jgi:hypothetical protein
VVVTMMLTSALTGLPFLSVRLRILSIRYGKFLARFFCSSPIEPELSITNRTSSRLQVPSALQSGSASVSFSARSSFGLPVGSIVMLLPPELLSVGLVSVVSVAEPTVVVVSFSPPSPPQAPSNPTQRPRDRKVCE